MKSQKRTFLFARRNLLEITRDPLSYVFCVGFPVIMLIVFRLLEHYTGGGAPWFQIKPLTPGIIIFSYTFVMLYTALLVSKDKSTSFLTRLFTSPMKAIEFLLGYAIPGMLIALMQTLLCFVTATFLGIFDGVYIPLTDMLLVTAALLPIMFLLVCLGILFGALFSEKAAPGLSSVIISLAGFLSGAWMPVETMGDFETVCLCLPFYPSVRMGRVITCAEAFGFDSFWKMLLIVGAYVVLGVVGTVLVFRHLITKDNK